MTYPEGHAILWRYELWFEHDATVVEQGPDYFFSIGIEVEAQTPILAYEQASKEIYELFNPFYSEVCDIGLIYLERLEAVIKTLQQQKPNNPNNN